MWGIHRSPVNSYHKGQWRRVSIFSLICVWTNVWVNNRDACDLRRNRDHHDVTTHRNTQPRNQSSHMTNSFSVSVHNLFTQRALEIFSKWNILNDITPLFLQLSSMLLHPTCPKFQSRSLDILNDPSVLCYMKHIRNCPETQSWPVSLSFIIFVILKFHMWHWKGKQSCFAPQGEWFL